MHFWSLMSALSPRILAFPSLSSALYISLYCSSENARVYLAVLCKICTNAVFFKYDLKKKQKTKQKTKKKKKQIQMEMAELYVS